MHWTEKAMLKKDSAQLALPVIQVLGVSIRPSFNGLFYNGRGKKYEKLLCILFVSTFYQRKC